MVERDSAVCSCGSDVCVMRSVPVALSMAERLVASDTEVAVCVMDCRIVDQGQNTEYVHERL